VETLVLERTTPIDTLFYFMGASGQLRIVREPERATATIAPIINPDDYDNDTDYLNAVPGLMEAIDAEIESPMSEDEDVPENWIASDV
jgi:hypothetical protein